MTRYIYLSILGTAVDFVSELNNYLVSNYTTLVGNLGFEKSGSPALREVLLENHNFTHDTGVTLVKNY